MECLSRLITNSPSAVRFACFSYRASHAAAPSQLADGWRSALSAEMRVDFRRRATPKRQPQEWAAAQWVPLGLWHISELTAVDPATAGPGGPAAEPSMLRRGPQQSSPSTPGPASSPQHSGCAAVGRGAWGMGEMMCSELHCVPQVLHQGISRAEAFLRCDRRGAALPTALTCDPCSVPPQWNVDLALVTHMPIWVARSKRAARAYAPALSSSYGGGGGVVSRDQRRSRAAHWTHCASCVTCHCSSCH